MWNIWSLERNVAYSKMYKANNWLRVIVTVYFSSIILNLFTGIDLKNCSILYINRIRIIPQKLVVKQITINNIRENNHFFDSGSL